MAKEEKEAVDQDEGQDESKGSKLPWIIVLLVVVLSNGVWAGVFVVMGNPATASAEPVDSDPAEPAEPADVEPGPLVELEPFVVNLNDPASSRYLRIGISVELGAEEDREALEKRMVPLRDGYISELSMQAPEHLLSARDKERLRDNLLTRAQRLVSKRAVRDVYFTEFMMQ